MIWETRHDPTPDGWRLSLRVVLDSGDMDAPVLSTEERLVLARAGSGRLIPVLDAIKVVALAVERGCAKQEARK